MPAQIHLTLPWPPSANAYWQPARGRGLVPSDEARNYKALLAQVAAAARLQPLVGQVHLHLRAYRPRRVGDLDNTLKVLLDALSAWAYLDDSQVEELHAYRLDDADRPQVEVLAVGESCTIPEEAAAHRRARAERAMKARWTRNRRRAHSSASTLPRATPAVAPHRSSGG